MSFPSRLTSSIVVAASLCLVGCSVRLDFDKFDVAPCAPSDEVCNGLDDDCDKSVDEEPTECSVANGTTACVENVCVPDACNDGFGNCDDEPLDCEIDTTSARAHCGGCGIACGIEQACVASTCSDLTEGWADFHVSTSAAGAPIGDIAPLGEGVAGAITITASSTSFAGTSLAGQTAGSYVFGVDAGGALSWNYRVANGTPVFVASNATRDSLYVLGSTSGDAIIYRSSVLRNYGGAGDLFLLATDANGAVRWGHHYGTDGWARALATSGDDVWVVATYNGALRIDATTFDASHTRTDGVFVARQQSNSSLVWERDFPNGGRTPDDLAVDESGNAFLVLHGGTDFVVRRFEANGDDGWSRTLDCPNGFTNAADVAVGHGIVVVTGNCMGQVSVAGQLVTAPFLAGFDASSGELRFARRTVGYPESVATISDGFALAGDVSGAPDFGAGPHPSSANWMSYVEAIDPRGTNRFAYVFGGDQYGVANRVVETAAGALVLAGSDAGTLTFGARTNANTDGADGYLVELRR